VEAVEEVEEERHRDEESEIGKRDLHADHPVLGDVPFLRRPRESGGA
jgi:hypothetical protein